MLNWLDTVEDISISQRRSSIKSLVETQLKSASKGITVRQIVGTIIVDGLVVLTEEEQTELYRDILLAANTAQDFTSFLASIQALPLVQKKNIDTNTSLAKLMYTVMLVEMPLP